MLEEGQFTQLGLDKYTYVYACIRTHKCTFVQDWINIHLYIRMYTHTQLYIRRTTSEWGNTYIFMYMWVYTCTHLHMYYAVGACRRPLSLHKKAQYIHQTTCAYIHIHMYGNIHMYTYIRVMKPDIYIYICMWIYSYLHICINIHTCKHVSQCLWGLNMYVWDTMKMQTHKLCVPFFVGGHHVIQYTFFFIFLSSMATRSEDH